MGRTHERKERRTRHLQPRVAPENAPEATRPLSYEKVRWYRRKCRHESVRRDRSSVKTILQSFRDHRAARGYGSGSGEEDAERLRKGESELRETIRRERFERHHLREALRYRFPDIQLLVRNASAPFS